MELNFFNVAMFIVSLGSLIFAGWIFLIAFKKWFLEDVMDRLSGKIEVLRISQSNGFKNVFEDFRRIKTDIDIFKAESKGEQDAILECVKVLSKEIKENRK